MRTREDVDEEGRGRRRRAERGVLKGKECVRESEARKGDKIRNKK